MPVMCDRRQREITCHMLVTDTDTYFQCPGIQASEPWSTLNVNGDSVRSGVYHVLLMRHVHVEGRVKFSVLGL